MRGVLPFLRSSILRTQRPKYNTTTTKAPRSTSIPQSRSLHNMASTQQHTLHSSPEPAPPTVTISTSSPFGPEPPDAHEKKHHVRGGKGFQNPWPSFVQQTPWQILLTMIWRRLSGQANIPKTNPPPLENKTPHFHPATTLPPSLRATWLGHAAFLVEFPSGLRILTDPVFEPHCSPVSFLGPKRYTPAGTSVAAIPMLDAVLLSHNHYDHCSAPTLARIHAQFPLCRFFVPLGNADLFRRLGIKDVVELDWWQGAELRVERPATAHRAAYVLEAKVSALPCQHISSRMLFDLGRALWASWSVESGGKKVWFAGDTGYRSVPHLPPGEDDYGPAHAHLPRCPAFAQIGALRGPFDLGLIPIGAYAPRHVMSPMHANPFDAVEMFRDTRCRRAVAMHWGTWVLTEEDVGEPVELLAEALRRRGIDEARFRVCVVGEGVVVEDGEEVVEEGEGEGASDGFI